MAGDFDAMLTDAALLSSMAIRFAAKADALAQEWAATQPNDRGDTGPDPLEPIRDAMRQYEAAIEAGQHGRIAAAHFVDAVYAVLTPTPPDASVPVVVKTDEPEPLQWNADEADAEGWGG